VISRMERSSSTRSTVAVNGASLLRSRGSCRR
jgi:hypothetical protein